MVILYILNLNGVGVVDMLPYRPV